MKHEEQFEHQLKQLHQARKETIHIPLKQKASILSLLTGRKRTPWYMQTQVALGIAAVAVLFHLAYQRHAQPSVLTKYYDASLYAQIEVHDYTNEQYSKMINRAHQQAQTERDDALANLIDKELLTGRLMARDEGWYIESCDKTRLVELKADLIQQLNLTHNIDLSIEVGDALQIENNSQGQIIALLKPIEAPSCG
ncbi:hypothetical protein PULV_a1320 [Pseudoalteromonas ulvae UL12]|uniref:Uncharacterized protein n=1 Tax=Pseudoalteromonas ulvae TaxID=107327 RepID=A0A244CTV1_PSEDV|nr:hypothetical protein [Pseudoalteromonas ulvae]MBE0363823.1 hypothetical protein [Pseudoalteromonas ulvae UL12]OUL58659.1 hypothetical protein B1199_10115 [Pseudoalteromonas ulvae]